MRDGKVLGKDTEFSCRDKAAKDAGLFFIVWHNCHVVNGLPTTARQYGEVVLPDASIRAESWYFSQKAVTVQGGYGAFFAVQVQSFVDIARVAFRFTSSQFKDLSVDDDLSF